MVKRHEKRTSPFLKWVGGKSQLLSILSKIIEKKSLTYYEPFLGGGAVFFYFVDKRRFRQAILNDINPELINCYKVVKDHLPKLLTRLDAYQQDPDWNTQTYFERIRAEKFSNPVEQAARTIYLNHVCYNGLYRTNRTGEFNAPFGKYDNPRLCDRGNIIACSEALQRFATLRNVDFSDSVIDAKAGDLIYFDPPYVPVSETSNFTSYAGRFGLSEQQKLADLFCSLFSRGIIVVQSNSDTPLVRELYKDFVLHVVEAKRSVNSVGDKRGNVNELIIIGLPNDLKIDVPAMSYLPIFPLKCADCGTLYSSEEIVCIKCGSAYIEEE
jgi:DNA adenine methylase